MYPEQKKFHKSESLAGLVRKNREGQKGVALVMTMLLLLLLTGLSVVMVVSTNSDLLTNGYYRGFRGAFYASDSGLNIVRQATINKLLISATANWGVNTQTFAPGTETTVQTFINNAYGTGFGQVTGGGQTTGSWPESFQLTAFTLSAPTCTPVGRGGTCAAPSGPGTVTGYSYIYPYSMVVQGRAQGTEKSTLSDRGAIIMNASLIANATTQSFAAWGMFIDQWPICNGSTLVPGTISGPVFTNGAWTFGTTGNYIFTDTVGSVSAKAGYQFGSCSQVAGPSATSGGSTIAPTFQNGFNLGQPAVPLPPNDYNQEQAVLDGKGVASGSITNVQLNAALRNISQTAYPVGGTGSGVYLPYKIIGGVPTFTGGGIYIEGNATVKLSTSGASAQLYTITQGGTTTTVTVNPATNTTSMVSGGTTLNISGIPDQIDPATSAVVGPATMVYCNGSITGLSGPGQGVAAIQDGADVTVTAANDVTITGDIVYKTPPVTLAANQIPGTPADTLIPGNNNGQALGIFTANGNINLANTQANGNLEIDASLATICDPSSGGCSGNGGLVNTGSGINTLNIVGGRIQNQIMNIGATTRNVFFDRRYAQNGFAPPWFPSTTVSVGNVGGATITPNVSRVQWINETAYF
jgi:Tfp pilus assembly protein PilX